MNFGDDVIVNRYSTKEQDVSTVYHCTVALTCEEILTWYRSSSCLLVVMPPMACFAFLGAAKVYS
jgi:hypothetical protein